MHRNGYVDGLPLFSSAKSLSLAIPTSGMGLCVKRACRCVFSRKLRNAKRCQVLDSSLRLTGGIKSWQTPRRPLSIVAKKKKEHTEGFAILKLKH